MHEIRSSCKQPAPSPEGMFILRFCWSCIASLPRLALSSQFEIPLPLSPMELRRAITEVWRPKGDQLLPAHEIAESCDNELSTTKGGTVAPTNGAAPMENNELSMTKEGTPTLETLVNMRSHREQSNPSTGPVATPTPGLHPMREDPEAKQVENNRPLPLWSPTPPPSHLRWRLRHSSRNAT
jgi:hypothetical protein